MCLSEFIALGLVLRSNDHWVPHYLLAHVYMKPSSHVSCSLWPISDSGM